jgi:hypothetical protein
MPLYSIIVLSFSLGWAVGVLLTAYFARRENDSRKS